MGYSSFWLHIKNGAFNLGLPYTSIKPVLFCCCLFITDLTKLVWRVLLTFQGVQKSLPSSTSFACFRAPHSVVSLTGWAIIWTRIFTTQIECLNHWTNELPLIFWPNIFVQLFRESLTFSATEEQSWWKEHLTVMRETQAEDLLFDSEVLILTCSWTLWDNLSPVHRDFYLPHS